MKVMDQEVLFYLVYSTFIHDKMNREEIIIDNKETKQLEVFDFSQELQLVFQKLKNLYKNNQLSVVNLYVLGLIEKEHKH